MQLRGIEFEPIWDAPGVRGFFGEGYRHHHLPFISLWYRMNGSTRVAKTTTLDRREGNMPLCGPEKNFAPRELFPKCIWFDFHSGRTINSVALAGPGAKALIEHGLLEDRFGIAGKPFMISYMSVAKTAAERIEEFKQFIVHLKAGLQTSTMRGRIALQINISCPNTGLDPSHLVDEATAMLDLCATLGIPIIVKLNILAPIESAKRIADHPECDALCVTNALPFGSEPAHIKWEHLFPSGSPLELRNKQFGGGGYSGPEIRYLVARWVFLAKAAGITKPFNVGGSILSANDVDYYVQGAELRRGIDSVFIASAAIVRPWNIPSIIRRAHELLA